MPSTNTHAANPASALAFDVSKDKRPVPEALDSLRAPVYPGVTHVRASRRGSKPASHDRVYYVANTPLRHARKPHVPDSRTWPGSQRFRAAPGSPSVAGRSDRPLWASGS
jgi:hypothetical protein